MRRRRDAALELVVVVVVALLWLAWLAGIAVGLVLIGNWLAGAAVP